MSNGIRIKHLLSLDVPTLGKSDVQLGALASCCGFQHDHLTARTLKNLVLGGLV